MASEIKTYAYTFALHFVFIFCSSPQRVFMPQLAFHFFSLHLLSVCITWSLPSPTHGLMLLNSSFWTKPNFASDMKHVSPLMLLFNYQNPNRSFTFPFPFLSLLLLFSENNSRWRATYKNHKNQLRYYIICNAYS